MRGKNVRYQQKRFLIKLKLSLKKLLQLVFNPHFLLCFGIAWFVTNGWAYLAMGVGTLFQIGWLMAFAGAYLALLWIPFTPEKIITVAVAILLLRKLFPNDEKTLGQLRTLHEKAKRRHLERKARRRAKRAPEEKEGRETKEAQEMQKAEETDKDS